MTDPKTAKTVPEWLRAMAGHYGDAEAVVSRGGRVTYRDLDERSRLWARGLLARGVGKGSRIGLWLGNGVEWVVAWAAVARTGAVAVPLSTFFKEEELARVARHADLQGLITHRLFLGDDRLGRLERAFPGLAGAGGVPYALREAPFLRWIVALGDTLTGGDDGGAGPGWAAPLEWLTSGAGQAPFDDDFLTEVEAEVHPGEVGLMIYTSGSTADPKGVPHSHRNVLVKTHHLREMLPIPDGVRAYTAAPFFWVGGLTMSLFPVLDAGGTQFATDRFDAGEVLRIIGAERVERAVLYPHHLNALLEHPDFAASDRSSLNDADPRLLVGEAAAPKPPSDALRIGLGMTETFGGYWWGRPDPAGDQPPLRPGERRPPPLDFLQPGVELKVVDPSGRPVGDRERGEILIRGGCLTPGLHKVPWSETFDADGYFHTGDQGDVDGTRVRFAGRLGEMIKTAGANVAPGEVADVMRSLEGVAEAYVVGLPDAVRGEVVAAAVVPEPDAVLDPALLAATLRGRLSSFKVPAHIEVFDEAEIPWTPSLKVRRGTLGQMITARLAAAGPDDTARLAAAGPDDTARLAAAGPDDTARLAAAGPDDTARLAAAGSEPPDRGGSHD